ncbi:hypothetical protein B0I32_115138 [Nonomuraea fuscirosea]|uniref:ABC-2 family transporter n=1 Tax=Nonomuraea fuscirosea TaxID=1291556 RepID=A0A2T0MS35_9ACTN|nr:ABC transporter permease subunit [Nonomuraea fuscirosea]PRX61284.1 hypothetical protein B0I32_115138 [Nonomuraea fuscirosea]
MTDILRSEWTKIRSVRSTVWTLAAAAILLIGIGALINAAQKGSVDEPVTAATAIQLSLVGNMFASLAMATLGALVISSEYRTGGIRTSLMAVPKRLRLLTGKIVVFTATALVVSAVASAVSILLGLLIAQPPSVDPGAVAGAALGSALYLTACGLFGLGLGVLIRHTPGAIVSAIALMLVLPQLMYQLPGQWGRTVADYFTTNAGMMIVLPVRGDSALGPWSGFGVYLVWIAVTVAAGAVLLQRRDA